MVTRLHGCCHIIDGEARISCSKRVRGAHVLGKAACPELVHKSARDADTSLLGNVGKERVFNIEGAAVGAPTFPRRRLLCVHGFFHAPALVILCAHEVKSKKRSGGRGEMVKESPVYVGKASARM